MDIELIRELNYGVYIVNVGLIKCKSKVINNIIEILKLS